MEPTAIDNKPRFYKRPTLIAKKSRDSIAYKEPESDPPASTSIYLQYRFEEENGNKENGNEENGNYDLTINGSPTFNNYVELDGIDYYLNVGIDFEVKTLSFWFNLNNVNTDNYLLSFDNDFYIKVNSNSLDVQTDNENNCNISKEFFNNIWYNLALTNNNENYDIYLNNTKLPETIIYKNLSSSTLNIGKYITGEIQFIKYLNGKIADLRLYNTIKTEDEINTIYNEYNYILTFKYKPNDSFTFRIDDESPYSWEEAYDEAIANGKRMPTKTELLAYLASQGNQPIYQEDAWCPVVASEYPNGKDWIQIGIYHQEHYVGKSHTEAMEYPSWGDNSIENYSRFYCEVSDQTEYTVNFPEDTMCDILIVGGGGAGGFNAGGGGGAGGLVYGSGIIINGTYSIKVGNGGIFSGTYSMLGNVGIFSRTSTLDGGKDSSISNSTYNIIAKGGGSGADDYNDGNNGGSGGGGATDSSIDRPGGFTNQQTSFIFENAVLTGYGNDGGIGRSEETGGPQRAGGGGGGAGAAGNTSGNYETDNGESARIEYGGDGGIGREYDITGSATYYAGGGGGGIHNNENAGNPGSGGLGGGGNGADPYQAGSNGISGTGGGGGSGGGFGGIGGNGGSGIVIIKKISSIIYNFSHTTSLDDWNNYATNYGFTSTFNAGFEESSSSYYAGVWYHNENNENTGFISKEIPTGYTKLRVEYQALWDKYVSIYITENPITTNTADIVIIPNDTVTVEEGLKIFETDINPNTDKYLTIAERYSTLSNNLKIVFY